MIYDWRRVPSIFRAQCHTPPIQDGKIANYCEILYQIINRVQAMAGIRKDELKGYVSKRKRKMQEPQSNEKLPLQNLLSSYRMSQSGDKDLKKAKVNSSVPKLSTKLPTKHSKPVLSLQWHPVDYRLLLSAGLDGGVIVWDASRGDSVVNAKTIHGGSAIRDVEWLSPETIITAGYDCFAIQTDIGHQKEVLRLEHESYVSMVKPSFDNNLVLSGDSIGKLQMWDLRTGKVVKSFKGSGGKILDAAFLPPSQGAFIASSDIVRKNAFSQAINVWDIASGVTLTHQLYFEPFTCPCLKVHVENGDLLAQSNGNYIVIFAPEKPFKLNNRKRFEGHTVSGFDAAFDLSPDGSLLCSASSDGKAHFYDYYSSRPIRALNVSATSCLGVSWSTRSPSSQVAMSDWNGDIYVLE